MSSETLDLLPCPFCSAAGEFLKADGSYAVECLRCDCAVGKSTDTYGDDSHLFNTQAEAIAAWNRRAYTAQNATPDLLAALEGMLESLGLVVERMPHCGARDMVLGFFIGEAERAQAAIAKAKKEVD